MASPSAVLTLACGKRVKITAEGVGSEASSTQCPESETCLGQGAAVSGTWMALLSAAGAANKTRPGCFLPGDPWLRAELSGPRKRPKRFLYVSTCFLPVSWAAGDQTDGWQRDKQADGQAAAYRQTHRSTTETYLTNDMCPLRPRVFTLFSDLVFQPFPHPTFSLSTRFVLRFLHVSNLRK